MKDSTIDNIPRRREVFDGDYSEGHCRSIMLKLDRGRFQLGFLQGYYKVLKQSPASVDLAFIDGFLEDRKHPDKYRLSRRKATYVLANLADGTERLFKRKDKKMFLADSFLAAKKAERQKATVGPMARRQWKRVEESKVYYQLTGESVVQAILIPDPPTSAKPATVRVTHENSLGRVDSDVFVRLGNPKAPLEWDDFDTVSDWKQAALVEDLLDDGEGSWMLRGKAKGEGVYWSGTYEALLQFPKGLHLIEIKIISRVPEVCSIVLSDWIISAR